MLFVGRGTRGSFNDDEATVTALLKCYPSPYFGNDALIQQVPRPKTVPGCPRLSRFVRALPNSTFLEGDASLLEGHFYLTGGPFFTLSSAPPKKEKKNRAGGRCENNDQDDCVRKPAYGVAVHQQPATV